MTILFHFRDRLFYISKMFFILALTLYAFNCNHGFVFSGKVYAQNNNTACTNDGDVNTDNRVTIDDVSQTFDALFDPLLLNQCQKEHADVNNDGNVTIDDVSCIFDTLFGINCIVAPDDNIDPVPIQGITSFTDINHALPDTIYTSNTILLSGFSDIAPVTISGGINSTIVKNSIDTGLPSVTLNSGDTIAIRSKSSSSVGSVVTIDVKIVDKSLQWEIVTDSIKPLPSVSGTMAGYINGSFSVNEAGNANYTIPIKVSPGTAGLQPNLNLTYSSSGGNALLGSGWTMSGFGLSAITRVPATIANDKTFSDGIDFNKDDRFSLDGDRLILARGVYGGNSSEYRTEHDTFQKIVAVGQQANAPQSFKVNTKSGLQFTFGGSEDSRIEVDGRSDILVWALNRVEDTVGNFMTITYDKVGLNSEYRPVQIAYTGNKSTSSVLDPYNFVTFSYEDRPDKVTKYIHGRPVQISKRLKRIETHNFRLGNIYRAYNLNYDQTVIGQKSYLTSVQEESPDGTKLLPTTFTWQGIDDNFSFQGANSGIWNGHSLDGSETIVADFDANGRMDIAAKKEETGVVWNVCLANNSGSGFDCQEWTIVNKGRKDIRIADFNGDMKSDVIKKADTGPDMWKVKFSTGSGFENAPNSGLWQGPTGSINDCVFGDFNGDGLSDIALQVPNEARWHVGLSSGAGFDAPGSGFWPGPSSSGPANTICADFNGDGKCDLAARVTAQPNQWHVALSNGTSGFTEDGHGIWTGLNSSVDNTFVGDFNGDAISDLVGWEPGEKRGKIALSTGTGFKVFDTSVWDTHNGLKDGERNNFVLDINMDGYSDLLKKNDLTPGTWNAYLSTGNNFIKYLEIPAHDGELDKSFFLDLTGDGLPDLMTPVEGDQWQVQITEGFKPLMIKNITNGHGAKINVKYNPLTDSSLHTKDNDVDQTFRFDLAAPIYVVSSYTKSNGLGGLNNFSYHYTGAEMNRSGRGFRGFRRIDITDHQRNLITTTHYDQDHRFVTSKVLSREERINGILVSKVDNTLGIKEFGPFGAKYFFSFIEVSEAESYELDGSLIATTININEYDDFGNILKSITEVDDGANTFTKIKINQYKNDIEKWIVGKLIRSEVTKEGSGISPLKRTYGFEYNPLTSLLIKEITEPDDQEYRLETTYVRDGYGNVIQNTVSGAGFNPRTKSTEYDSKKRFIVKSTNALGHEDTRSYKFANLVSLTDANGFTTKWEYDGFRRRTLTDRANGTVVRTSYFLAESDAPKNAKHYIRTDTSGASPSVVYYDILDREIRTEISSFDGRSIYVDTHYNTLGQVLQKSDPYFKGDTPVWTIFEYDDLSRVIKITEPGNRITTTEYKGLISIVKNPKTQIQETEKNGIGQTVRIRDNLLNDVFYLYDSFGSLSKVVDPEGNSTEIQHDIRGNKILLNDMDIGITNYEYNALGELTRQTDANGNAIKLEYDDLGRTIRKDEPEGISSWEYDTKPNAIGKLTRVVSPNGFDQDYSYDSFGRLQETITSIDNAVKYSIYNTYDLYGRLDTLTYPTGLSVKSVYNSFGYKSEIRRVSDNHLYWKISSINASGQLKEQTFGNGLVSTKDYDPFTGHVKRIRTAGVQDLDFKFDIIGNLTQRRDLALNLEENFSYDGLNRLTHTSVAGGDSVEISYDSIGNITHKSDVGIYSYSTSAPHAVTFISDGPKANSYSYDNNGNRVSSLNGTIRYTSYDKPFEINHGANQTKFRYGPNRNRFEQISIVKGNTTKTHYIGSIYEKVITSSLHNDIHYIKAGGKTIAIETFQGSDNDTIRYLHRDHLSSVSAITDDNGAVVERLSYDAWGIRRASDWSIAVPDLPIITARGFTGHEHLDDVSLIHMNGRVYDPVIGRFLSPDPFVQALGFSQSLNRYSYVLNNPLTLVDPTGYNFISDFISDTFEDIGSFISDNKDTIINAGVTLIATSLGGPLGPLSSFLTAGLEGLGLSAATAGIIGSGASAGFLANLSGTILQGGSLLDGLRSGLVGGIMSGISAGVIPQIDLAFGEGGSARKIFGEASDVARGVVRGVVDGAMSELQGGDFKDAFKANVFFGIERFAIDKITDFNNEISKIALSFSRKDGVLDSDAQFDLATDISFANANMFFDEIFEKSTKALLDATVDGLSKSTELLKRSLKNREDKFRRCFNNPGQPCDVNGIINNGFNDINRALTDGSTTALKSLIGF